MPRQTRKTSSLTQDHKTTALPQGWDNTQLSSQLPLMQSLTCL